MNVGNRTAIMDITQRITGIVSLLAIKSSSNETKLAVLERQVRGVMVQQPGFRYADRFKLRLPPESAPLRAQCPPRRVYLGRVLLRNPLRNVQRIVQLCRLQKMKNEEADNL